ncbi:holin [Paracoccus phage ParKuw1]|uniref:Holin n=1 Tax=Paracoccus phage ParKuw1 TaxID=3032415 RepID=A0AAF0FNM9_9CAUD|nr:holin [Paracoccus phage ParKuw1]
MSVIGAITASQPILGGLFNLIDKLFTTDEEREAAKLRVLELEKAGELAQIGVNTQEAKHSSLFVAGWRPFIGWVCGLAFAWTFFVYPILTFAVVALGLPVPLHLLPVMDLSEMMPVLLGMLGLGAMRSYERRNGVERNHMTNDGVDRRATGG